MFPKFAVLFIYLVIAYTDCQNVIDNSIVTGVVTPASGIVSTDKVEKNDPFGRVKIQLYYESLCPDCRTFDSKTFKETVLELRSYLDVHVYPFGNARILENGTVTCQHGPPECYGNKLHACAIDLLNNITLAVLYNSCLMDDSQSGRGSNDDAADVCGKSMEIDSEAIKQCAKGQKGEDLLKFYGEESRKTPYMSVPHILINGNIGREDHFKEDVCKSFLVPPKQCQQ